MISALPPAVRLGDVANRTRDTRARPAPTPVFAPHPTVVRLWLPLTLLFLLLAPFALLLSPLLYLVPRPWSVNPFATVIAVGIFLLSLGGTDVDVRTHGAIVRIKIF